MLCTGAWRSDNGLHKLVDPHVPLIDALLAPFPPNASCNGYHMSRFIFQWVVKLNVLDVLTDLTDCVRVYRFRIFYRNRLSTYQGYIMQYIFKIFPV